MVSNSYRLLTSRELEGQITARKPASLQALRADRKQASGSTLHSKCLNDLKTLKQHIQEERPLCMLLHEAITKCFPGPHDGITFTGGQWGNRFVDNRELTFMNDVYSMQFFVADENSARLLLEPIEKDKGYRMTSIPDNTSSQETLATVRSWLSTCTASHTRCGVGDDSTLPSRVIDVGYPVRLYETTDEVGRYVCLSHCWGKHQLIRTLKHNLNQMKSEIPWASLPQTFQDAIDFTRRLGLRYIWIDSLCIIQDDALDWKREAAKMGDIYRHGHITLAASKATDSRGGLYSAACGIKVGPHKLHIDNDVDDSVCSLYARLELRHMYDIDGKKAFPLLERAWIYQERLLSPRVVHFAESEIVWECSEDYRCECGESQRGSSAGFSRKILFASHLATLGGEGGASAWPSGFVREEAIRMPDDSPTTNSAQPLNNSPTPRFMTAQEQIWRQMMQEYTSLGITYIQDLFPAVAGIAKVWGGPSGDQYLAGLWRASVLRDMLWQVKHLVSRIEPPIAPTWSWASLAVQGTQTLHYDSDQSALPSEEHGTGAVSWSRRCEEYRDIAEVIDAFCDNTSYVNEVVTGHITLLSLSLPAVLTWWPRTSSGQGPARTLHVGGLYLTNNAVAGVQIDTALHPLDERWSENIHVVRITDFVQPDLTPDMACLLLREKQSSSTTIREQEYERVGYLRIVPGSIDGMNLVPRAAWGTWENWQELRNNNYSAQQRIRDEVWERVGRPHTMTAWDVLHIYVPYMEQLRAEFESQARKQFRIV